MSDLTATQVAIYLTVIAVSGVVGVRTALNEDNSEGQQILATFLAIGCGVLPGASVVQALVIRHQRKANGP